ncbi:hypothetical protein [Mucilaginibacter ginkgonis]|uniref:Uncharacterized protein n=1 Tax=Mucilaginibacter ginkgonis TaxID=2682091 RepID=A0A6I4IMY2_9SPHI|nr:hypothetical protein [Mucilaginibacter ginkgonis]QQL49898.1 hypothetical protein GO620_000155 [Mucilaginibacter ginkgonis]
MENIDINFLTNLGWQLSQTGYNTEEKCLFKHPYPIELCWENSQKGFRVIFFDQSKQPIQTIENNFIKTESDYDRLIMPILKILQQSHN